MASLLSTIKVDSYCENLLSRDSENEYMLDGKEKKIDFLVRVKEQLRLLKEIQAMFDNEAFSYGIAMDTNKCKMSFATLKYENGDYLAYLAKAFFFQNSYCKHGRRYINIDDEGFVCRWDKTQKMLDYILFNDQPAMKDDMLFTAITNSLEMTASIERYNNQFTIPKPVYKYGAFWGFEGNNKESLVYPMEGAKKALVIPFLNRILEIEHYCRYGADFDPNPLKSWENSKYSQSIDYFTPGAGMLRWLQFQYLTSCITATLTRLSEIGEL